MANKPKPLEPQAVTRTSASSSGASPDTEDEDDDDDNDDDECRLVRRTRSSMGASQVPQPKAAESGTTDSGWYHRSKTL